MEKEKQLKIDALMQSIDKRIEVNQSVVRMALNDAANAHENIRFAKYVRAQVRDILGLTGITGAAATTEATAGSFRIENQTGRNGKTGDLVMSNGKHNFVLVLISDRKAWQQKGYTPEGIYVIAPNGETGMISLHNMSLSNPEKGSLSKSGADVCMPFGGYGVHVDGLVEYGKDDDRKNPVINRAGEEIDDSFYGYLPSDKFVNCGGAESKAKGKYYYFDDDDHLLPIPFLSDGVVNPLFGQGDNGKVSFLGDGDSVANTDAIIKLATAQKNWKTDAAIEKKYEAGYYPAACTCRRYHTEGTEAGDWNLPAIAVNAAWFYDFKTVQNALEELAKDGLAVPLDESNSYWSSTERSQYSAYYLYTANGYVYGYSKGSNYLVRAFCRLPRI